MATSWLCEEGAEDNPTEEGNTEEGTTEGTAAEEGSKERTYLSTHSC